MGNIGVPELIIIFTIALIIFGPRKLPELGKSLGKSLAEFKRASNELKSTLDEEIRSEERRSAERQEPPRVAAPVEPIHASDTTDRPEHRHRARHRHRAPSERQRVSRLMALVPFPSVTPGDDEDDDPAIDDSGSKMSFLEHLDELRKRLIYICYSLLAGCVVAYIFIGKIFDFIMKPMQHVLPTPGGGAKLIYTSRPEPFMLCIKIGFLAGIFIASPLIL